MFDSSLEMTIISAASDNNIIVVVITKILLSKFCFREANNVNFAILNRCAIDTDWVATNEVQDAQLRNPLIILSEFNSGKTH